MSKEVSRAGKGLFGFVSKNPTIIGLGILAVTLFIFRDRIANFVSGGITGAGQAIGGVGAGIGEFFGGLELPKLPEITLPSLPFEVPQPILPEIELPPVSAGIPFIDPLGQGLGGFFGIITDIISNIFEPIIPKAQPEVVGMEGLPIVPEIPIAPPIAVAPSIAEQVIAPFTGGGISFEGGFIFETPIQNLSLSQIIDRFMVTASQAANIRAIAEGFTPEEQAFLSQGPVDVGEFIAGGPAAVSDPAFVGLTPQQIIDRILGGPITRF